MANEDFDFEQITNDVIAPKILHVLEIYPKLSASMLQVGIGTAVSSKIWHPVLEDLKKQGLVKVEIVHARSPSGRDMSYQVISLNKE